MEFSNLIISLEHKDALNIRLWLGKDEELKEKISTRAEQVLKQFDPKEITDQVFKSLNGIDVTELWERSGEGYYGYVDPTKESGVMIEEVVDYFLRTAKMYRSFGWKEAELAYTRAVYEGIMRYAEEGSNDFRGAAPDDPYIIADNIHYDWKQFNDENDWIIE